MTVPPLLALETSTEVCSAALHVNGEIRQCLELAGQSHSQRLIPMVDALLAEAGLTVSSLGGIAVAVGPGSFTGLRIATAVGQGMALGAGLPVAAVGTLDAMAWADGAEAVLVCVDARMGEFYLGAYHRSGQDIGAVLGPMVVGPDALPDLPDGRWSGVGNGFALQADLLERRWPDRLTRRNPQARPEARDVLSLAMVCHPDGFTDPPESLVPLYVRDKVALTMAER